MVCLLWRRLMFQRFQWDQSLARQSFSDDMWKFRSSFGLADSTQDEVVVGLNVHVCCFAASKGSTVNCLMESRVMQMR